MGCGIPGGIFPLETTTIYEYYERRCEYEEEYI